MTFFVYINGGDFEKSFAREFIRHVCGGGPNVDDQIIWRLCTRKRLILTSPELVDRLQRVNQKVFWPNGQLFKCKLIENKREYRHNSHVDYHQHYHRYPKANYNQRRHMHENGIKRLHRHHHDIVNNIRSSGKSKTTRKESRSPVNIEDKKIEISSTNDEKCMGQYAICRRRTVR
ncbi:late expression factor 6 [Apocheima cinerarium nucleopolyhedrovirus]|uniref:late expression factor 6 n=1 Tax=Apocheima cinerarium nucleopolyhedrovirus TaxID=307461 RepID=UPI0001D920CC|nr:late expression factor 6 [Apocheima cinerarium nucleopolyhedrovirus]ADB84465.1 late expression factor 6 [Apocheima cinerarium nucleopolyhedrovirus]